MTTTSETGEQTKAATMDTAPSAPSDVIARLRREIAELKRQVATLRAEKKELAAANGKLQARIEELEKELAAARAAEIRLTEGRARG
jgi:septal ring factor EnvC (AmiA/AmiB activator)